jgi:methionyl-tRNA formyltransferase
LALPSDVAAGLDAAPFSAAFAVQTGDGLLAPLELQREGRRRLAPPEFLRGLPGVIGKRLG